MGNAGEAVREPKLKRTKYEQIVENTFAEAQLFCYDRLEQRFRRANEER